MNWTPDTDDFCKYEALGKIIGINGESVNIISSALCNNSKRLSSFCSTFASFIKASNSLLCHFA